MRLKVIQAREARHADCVSGVGWSNSDEVLSFGDDQRLLKWNMINLEANKMADLPSGFYATSLHFFPRSISKQNDIFAVTTSDGKLHLFSRTGKIDRSVEAHKGAALCVRWSSDGTGILTSGQDGTVKMWSRQGLLRSVLATLPSPSYSCAWNGQANKILYTCGESAYIKSLKMQVAPLSWKAHDGIVLCADWSAASDLIVTGGEDCKFKVWDSFGRVLFSSSLHEYPITSLSFSPDGALFAVGSFNLLRLCDKAGWAHSLDILSSGSLMALAWSPDGTQVAAGTAGGHVVHAHIIERRVSYRNLDVVQTKWNIVEVRDVSSEAAYESLETKERVTRMSIAFGYLVLVTTKQSYIYNDQNWNTPVLVDLKEGAVSVIVQAEKLFLLADGAGLYVFGYEGRLVCELKLPNSALGSGHHDRTIALSGDTVAVVDKLDPSQIHVLDPQTSKNQGDGKISHSAEIDEICLSQSGNINNRLLAMIDAAGSVYVSMIKTFGKVARTAKLGTLVQRICFHDQWPMLAGLQEGQLVVWPCPSIAFDHRDLLEKTTITKKVEQLGRFPELLNFTQNSILLRRSDGSLLPSAFSPFPAALLAHLEESKWDNAIRLCRHMNDDSLWAMLAGLAMQARNIYAAEIAYGSLDEIEKVEFLRDIRNEKDKDVKAALMTMLSGKTSEADIMLEKAGHPFRALMLNITSFKWDRALDIALKNRDLLEIVIGYRQKYLQEMGRQETNEKFLKYQSQVEIDWPHIRQTLASHRARAD
ncbi:che-2 [Pristionchus pacificus]|nr:che-2 [Pristionchus pacificus]